MLFFRALHSVSQAAWLGGTLSLLVSSCSVYDADSLQLGAPPASHPRGAAAGTRDDPLLKASSLPADGSTEFGPDDPFGRLARDSDGGSEPDAPAHCGDGRVNGAEKCDVAIPQGEPGACPDSCPDLAPCVPRVRNGTGCQTECVLRGLTCDSGDGCCPGNCTKDNDRDCSARCGDGIVQQSSGETCEPDTDQPCVTSAAACDDADNCTLDRLTGSQANCNAACIHERIEAPNPSDGCCPEAGNANTDPDCAPRCGNGAVEPGEDCDGGEHCTSDCKLNDASEVARCLEQAKTDCERCACMQCTAAELACRLGKNAQDNKLCSDILVCSQREKCLGNTCYCGSAPGCVLPDGPCRTEVEAAAGILSLQVAQQVGDPNTTLGKSYLADQCRVMKCSEVCR